MISPAALGWGRIKATILSSQFLDAQQKVSAETCYA